MRTPRLLLKDREIMARLGLEFEGHVLVLLGYDLAPEPPGFFRNAFSPLLIGQPFLVLLFAVPPEPHLTDNPFKQLLHIVLHGGRGLNELAVKHNGTGSALCKIFEQHMSTGGPRELESLHILYGNKRTVSWISRNKEWIATQ